MFEQRQRFEREVQIRDRDAEVTDCKRCIDIGGKDLFPAFNMIDYSTIVDDDLGGSLGSGGR